MSRFSILTVILTGFLAFLCESAFAESPKFLKVGGAVVDSTPTHFPAIINGNFLPQYCDVVNDPLHVRALVIDDGTTCVAFAVADVCILPDDVANEAKRRIAEKIPALPVERIACSSTHCHSAPSLVALLGVPRDENYVPLFLDRFVEAVVKAYENRQDAKTGFAQDFNPNDVFCRRFILKEGAAMTVDRDFTGSHGDVAQMNPGGKLDRIVRRTGQADPTVSVVYFKTPDDRPLAVLANSNTHYAGSRNLSADYFGVFCTEIGKRLGADGNFTALAPNGTSGDTNCIDFFSPDRKFDMNSVANHMADAAERAIAKMKFADWVPVSMIEQKAKIGVRKGTPEQVAKAKQRLAELEKAGKEVSSIEDAYALSTVKLADWPDQKELTLQVIRLGDCAIAFLPNEAYSFTGTELRRFSPAGMTFTVGLANGYAGYLPTPEQFELGGYTTWRTMSSFCEEQAEPKIRGQLQSMIQTLFSAQ